MKEFRIAFPKTIPIMAAYIFLGVSYGILMTTRGFPFWLPVLTALLVYTGSLEFLLTDILLSSYDPLSALITALMIGSRHIFYGMAMLPKYRGTGKAKFYLIYTCSDETFAVNYSTRISAGLDKTRFYTSVSALDQAYWVCGSAIGGLCGSLITFDTTGLDFIMTAMFVTIFMNQWLSDSDKMQARRRGHVSGRTAGQIRRTSKVTEDANAASDNASDASAAVKNTSAETAAVSSISSANASGPATAWLCAHGSELIGVAGSLVCLAIFGPDRFIIPTMILVLILLTVFRRQLDTAEEWNLETSAKKDPETADIKNPDASEAKEVTRS